jgi:hypothetical protein
VTVSLLEILAAARAHAAPLAAESAGYLLLAVADHVVAAPRVATADDVELTPDGCVRLRARRAGGSDVGVEPAIRRLLARTLEVSSSVGPALRRAAERREEAGLPALVRELETALIPVNRAAAKRALSRLHRETERAKSAGKLDALLDAELASVAVAAPSPSAAPVTAPAPAAAPVTAAPASVAAPAPVAAPVTAAPVAAPSVAPVVSAPPVVATLDPIALLAQYSEPSPLSVPPVVAAPRLPAVVATATRAPAPRVAVPAPEFTPEPLLAVGEQAFTKPEPVVQRARERGSATPRLGTLVTLQTLPGEEGERTERAPAVSADEPEPELDLSIDVELEASPLPTPVLAAPQPLLDPEPSRLPDVLTAMVALHAGIDADEAPTRIRDVVTELRVVPASPQVTPEPSLVEDAWLTQSSLEGVVSSAPIFPTFESERVDPAIHEALTWDPGPVVAATASPGSLPPGLLIVEPAPEPSPYAPAVLPSRTSDVSELLDSFYVSDAAEERELRSALKGMAGLELTPMPHPYVRHEKES